MVIAVEQVVSCSATHSVAFVTDSQFVADILSAIESGTIWRHPHKQAHWDLIQRLLELWDSSRYFVLKIKSHQTLSDANNQLEAWHIHGNACADEAAGKARLTDDLTFSTLCQPARVHRLQESNHCDKLYAYLVDLALSRMLKIEQHRCPDVSGAAPAGMQSTSAHTAYLTQMQKLRVWVVQGHLFEHPAEPHRVVFWCCPWGTNLARMVWLYCRQLSWPCPDTPPITGEQGISWTELACSFMLWSRRPLPIKLREANKTLLLPYDDPRVSVLPLKQRSVRVLAENFRWIVKHIQTFSRSHIIPQYKKQGSSSLRRLGFTPYHEGGISRRPQLPNAPQMCDFLHGLLQNMPHEPPYHTEIPLPDLPADTAPNPWPVWPEVPADQRDSFLVLIRNATARKKDFDTIRHPTAS